MRDVGGVRFAVRTLEGIPAKDLRGMADAAKKQLGSGVVAIATVTEGKAALVVGVSEDLTARFSAVDLVKAGAEAMGGKGGGGRPDMAQAGAPDGARIAEAMAAIEQTLRAAA